MEPFGPGLEKIILGLIELYNESCAGKTLKETLVDDETVAIATAMAHYLSQRVLAEYDDPAIQTAALMTEGISIGIFLAELGKTCLLKPRGMVN